MAEIRPFKSWRYHPNYSGEMSRLTAPLFDVVTTQQLAELYDNPMNCIHLSVPAGGAKEAALTLKKWKDQKVLAHHSLPAIYPYYQYFRLPGDTSDRCRKGFICNIKVHDWEDGVILRHENTIPGSVGDRFDILEETNFQVSPTHGLYTDESLSVEDQMDESMQNPLYVHTSEQGVTDKISIIQDHLAIRKIMTVLQDKKIILADGHHRYEASLRYAREKGLSTDKFLPHESHLMWLTNTASSDLTILPTHRMIRYIDNFDEAEFLKKIESDFEVVPKEEFNELITGQDQGRPTFRLLTGTKELTIRLKEHRWNTNPWPFPKAILKLDLTVLHYFIIEKLLGIPGKDQRGSEQLLFERDEQRCRAALKEGSVQIAILTHAVSISTVTEVCASGFTLPQKSTYFYPKATSGFVFSSLLPEESRIPAYANYPESI